MVFLSIKFFLGKLGMIWFIFFVFIRILLRLIVKKCVKERRLLLVNGLIIYVGSIDFLSGVFDIWGVWNVIE